ncbi:MAG: hypothetical protein ACRDB0_02085 [Paraclostridium sp.]
MSRVEKRIEAESKKRNYKFFFRFTFILLMVCIMSICLFEIDKNAILMFGEVENYNVELFLNNLGNSAYQTLNDIYNKISELNNLIPK